MASDEAWHYIEGAPLALFDADPGFEQVEMRSLGPFVPGAEPLRVVPHGRWQAARSTGAYTLVACTVGPGFDFADFEMLRDRPDEAAFVRTLGGDAAALV